MTFFRVRGVVFAVIFKALFAMFSVVSAAIFSFAFAATVVTEITPVIAHELFAALSAGKSFSHV